MSCLICNGNTLNLGTYPCLKNWATGVFFCKDCGSIFRYPMPNEHQITEYYDHLPFRISDRILEMRLRRSRFQANALVKMLHRLDVPCDATILDLGAGIGGLVYALREKGFYNTAGMEPRQIARDYAAKSLNLDLKQGWLFDARKFVDSNHPRLLILSHVMEHLANPTAALKYLKQNYPGSLLWIEVPDGESDARMQGKHVAWELWLEQHLISYTSKGLSALLEANGMEVVSIERGAVRKMLPQIREREFRLSSLCAEASTRIGIGPRIIAKLIPQLIVHLTSLMYLRMIQRIPMLQMPDSPFYLRVTVKI